MIGLNSTNSILDMNDPEVRPINPPNYGWLEYRLTDEEFSYVRNAIANKKRSYKKNLAGNITSSSLLEDKDDYDLSYQEHHKDFKSLKEAKIYCINLNKERK